MFDDSNLGRLELLASVRLSQSEAASFKKHVERMLHDFSQVQVLTDSRAATESESPPEAEFVLTLTPEVEPCERQDSAVLPDSSRMRNGLYIAPRLDSLIGSSQLTQDLQTTSSGMLSLNNEKLKSD